MTTDEFLAHHGVKGMRWGHRKEQPIKSRKPESSTWKFKDAGNLSDEELNRRNSRLQREKQYRDMTKSKGRKFMEAVGKNANKIMIASLVGVSAAAMSKNYKSLLSAGHKYITGEVLNPNWMKINLSKLR